MFIFSVCLCCDVLSCLHWSFRRVGYKMSANLLTNFFPKLLKLECPTNLVNYELKIDLSRLTDGVSLEFNYFDYDKHKSRINM